MFEILNNRQLIDKYKLDKTSRYIMSYEYSTGKKQAVVYR